MKLESTIRFEKLSIPLSALFLCHTKASLLFPKISPVVFFFKFLNEFEFNNLFLQMASEQIQYTKFEYRDRCFIDRSACWRKLCLCIFLDHSFSVLASYIKKSECSSISLPLNTHREVSDEVDEILTLVFENYKSLDESSPSGIVDVFGSVTGVAALALPPALKLYKLLHDILSPEAQLKLCRYFQNATKKRSRRHLSETDEFVSNNNENILMDPVALSTAYKKMKSLCVNIQREILTDIEIHKQDLLPSFIDLPNLSSSIYNTELFSILRAFLVSCPPAGPTPHVVELVLSTADFQRDLALWNISPIKGGVDGKELFHTYITFGSKIDALRCLNFASLTRYLNMAEEFQQVELDEMSTEDKLPSSPIFTI